MPFFERFVLSFLNWKTPIADRSLQAPPKAVTKRTAALKMADAVSSVGAMQQCGHDE